ncbi:MAG TPA: DUF6765 family protein [Candidatus Saccharimonadales bacterium]|nr:DUF6765 family protein [Candidatus Saccharimonadales bacterium]
MHFYGVYAICLASGLSQSDALLIAKASQSLDENAETSPFPETASIKDRWWFERGTLWHSLPSYVSCCDAPAKSTRLLDEPEAVARSYRQMVQRRLVDLYDRARDAPDKETSKIYFGQYLHALADSVTHANRYNLVGHLLSGHGPDIPGPERRAQTTEIARLVTGAIGRFQADRLHEQPRRIPRGTLDAVVDALTYAAPSGHEAIADRAEVVRQQLNRVLQPQMTQPLPKWCAGPPEQCGGGDIRPMAFDVEGKVKTGPVIPPTDWEKVAPKLVETAAAKAAKSVLNTLGLPDADLGGIDLTSVRLHYISDVAAPNQTRQFRASFAPEKKGASAPAGASLAAFATALMLPDSAWWVNLNPQEPERITDPMLGQTDAGRALLEADLLLKRVTWEVSDPATDVGKKYWAEELAGPLANAGSEWRVWIVPGECTARIIGTDVEIADCLLDVRLNIERLFTGHATSPEDQRALMDAKLRIANKYLVPALVQVVNQDARFAELRAIYAARAMAVAYKERFREEGTLSQLIDSLKIQALPRTGRREPKAIWAEMVHDVETTPFHFEIPVPGNSGQVMRIRGGGIVFDQVDITQASRQRLMTLTPPFGFGEGVLVATSPPRAKTSRVEPMKRHPYLAMALDAYQRSAPDAAIVAAAELMPALALFGDPAYDEVRGKIAKDPDTAAWLEAADSLKNAGGQSVEGPLQAMTFAVWSRAHSRQAVARLQSGRPSPISLLIYLIAAQSSPRAGDPKPEVLNRLLDNIVNSGPGRVELLSNITAIAAVITPLSASRLVEELAQPQNLDTLYLHADVVMLACESVVAVDVQDAAKLLLALRASFEKNRQQLPQSFSLLEKRVFRFAFKHAAAQNDPNPLEQVRLARFEWLSHPPQAIDRARRAVEAGRTTLPSSQREELIVQALPLLWWRNPQEALQLANSLQNQAQRMAAFSWIAMQSFDANAADMLLSQRILLDTSDWMN